MYLNAFHQHQFVVLLISKCWHIAGYPEIQLKDLKTLEKSINNDRNLCGLKDGLMDKQTINMVVIQTYIQALIIHSSGQIECVLRQGIFIIHHGAELNLSDTMYM